MTDPSADDPWLVSLAAAVSASVAFQAQIDDLQISLSQQRADAEQRAADDTTVRDLQADLAESLDEIARLQQALAEAEAVDDGATRTRLQTMEQMEALELQVEDLTAQRDEAVEAERDAAFAAEIVKT